MCFGLEAAWVPAAISAAGAGASALAQNQALKRQDRETARGIAARSLIQKQAGDRVQQQIGDIAKSNPDLERKAAQDDFMAALRKAKMADGSTDIGAPGAVSSRFGADASAARTGAAIEGQKLSSDLARIDAPTFQRQREATGLANTGIDIGMLGSNAEGLDFLTQMRAARAGRVDPLLSGVGQGLAAFGQAYAGRAKPEPKAPKKPTRNLPGAPS